MQHTPFFLNYGRHPNLPTMLGDQGKGKTVQPEAKAFHEEMQSTLTKAKVALEAAQQRMVQQAGKHRRDVTYKVNDLVLLSTKNMKPSVGAKKLMPKYVGPFQVIALCGPVAVKLLLTDGFERLHDVFHVSLVKPYKVRDGQSPTVVPISLKSVGDLPEFEVEAVMAHQASTPKSRKRKEGQVEGKMRVTAYFLKWKGYDPDHNTWEPTSCLDGCGELLDAYWQALGKKVVKRNRSHDIVMDV